MAFEKFGNKNEDGMITAKLCSECTSDSKNALPGTCFATVKTSLLYGLFVAGKRCHKCDWKA